MAQASYPTTGFSLPEGYRSLREAAMMFLKAFPNRDLRQAPLGQPMDGVGSAGQRLAREIPVYGRNTCSQAFEPLLTNTPYVFSEDLMRAEHAVWPTAPGGTYIDPAVKVEEFNAYLRKEIRLDVMRSQRTG